MDVLNVRRLAAVDMYGTAGTVRRRRLILAEFVVGVLGLVAVGVSVLHSASTPFFVVAGVWLIGVGANYVPLALHAVSLSSRGALERELEGVDVDSELRAYGVKQLLLLVPFLLAVLAVVQLRSR